MRKSFQGEVKVKGEGTVEAVFSTYDVIDHDGDVTSKSSFSDGSQVIMSAYNHQSWKGAPPWGYGTIHAGEDEAVFKGQFLMNTTHGADGFHTVKALSEQGLQEWSYSLGDVVSHKGLHKGAPARYLDSIVVTEVSPVIKGASLDTRTLSIKQADGGKQLSNMVCRLLCDAGSVRWGGDNNYVSLDDYDIDADTAVFRIRDWMAGGVRYVQVDFTRTETAVTLGDTETDVEWTTQYLPKGLKFQEHSTVVMAQVKSLIGRAQEVMSLRAEKGKTLSEDSRQQLMALQADLDLLTKVDPTPTTTPDDAALKLYLTWAKNQLQEV
jgi:hypothetical protein